LPVGLADIVVARVSIHVESLIDRRSLRLELSINRRVDFLTIHIPAL
jgi:hypothetical protein